MAALPAPDRIDEASGRGAGRRLTTATLQAGARQLATRDRDLARIVEQHGCPPMWGRPPGFATLVWIILEQQVSIASARTLFRRLRIALGGHVTPAAVTRAGISGLREFGLTRQKARYCNELAQRLKDGALDLRAVSRSPEPQARAMLLEVPGIGHWSVDIYFLMALRRPDVWPRGDLALAIAMRDVKRLGDVPSREQQVEMAERWSPWRSVAARILWMHYLAR
jgi:DNA-3-methyladenine glycosylase II